jgi:hypothetical protein
MARATFQDLPRELRDTIYALCLTSSAPIVPWAGHLDLIPPADVHNGSCGEEGRWCGNCPTGTYEFVHEQAPVTASLQNLTLGLLRCNRVISREAATIFYTSNTFVFQGYPSWQGIVDWLEVIGPENRGSLTMLKAEVQQPMHVFQSKDGTRSLAKALGYWADYEKVFPRHPHLLPSPEPREGIVENVNPAIEYIFQLLGCQGHRMTFYLEFNRAGPPGVNNEAEEYWEEQEYFGLDLVNLIEKWRVEHTATENGDIRVEVLWTETSTAHLFNQERAEIEASVWEVFELKYGPSMESDVFLIDKDTNISYNKTYKCYIDMHHQPYKSDEPVPFAMTPRDDTSVEVFLKRKPLNGPLVAEGPYPFWAPRVNFSQ